MPPQRQRNGFCHAGLRCKSPAWVQLLCLCCLHAGVAVAQPAGQAHLASAEPKVAPAPAAAPPGRMADAVQQLLEAVPDEALPPSQAFYFRSNEWRQDLLRPHLQERGGIYLGVGSDQSYTMAAMAAADYVFMVDFDARIPLVHRCYRVLVTHSPSPEDFLQRFSDAALPQTLALLTQALQADPQAGAVRQYFRRKHRVWGAYLRRVARRVRDGQPFTWLSDPTLYAHIRKLHRQGRIVSRVGDVTGSQTLQAYAKVAEALALPVRVVYFSNAEQFFNYTPQFRANMAALPTDDKSIVVRTINHFRLRKAAGCDWHYMVQEFRDFRQRLDSGVYRKSFALVGDLLAAGPPFVGHDGLSTMNQQTPRHLLERHAR